MDASTTGGRRLVAAALVAAVLVLGYAVWPGDAPAEPAAQPSSTPTSWPAQPDGTQSPPTIPRPADNVQAVRMADRPLMTNADWDSLSVQGWYHPVRQGRPRGDLSPCLHDPLSWPADRSAAARYVDTVNYQQGPAPVFQEYVLAFSSSAEAHQVVAAAAAEYDSCPREPGLGVEAAKIVDLREEGLPAELDEMVVVQRDVDNPTDMYVMRIARRGHIVVVLENTVESSDRSHHILRVAVTRAAGLPIACDWAGCATVAP